MASTDWLSQGTLVLASNNKGKIAEFEKLFAELNLPVEVIAQGKLDIEDAIEDGLSFVENAIIKARHASRISGKPAIADDSGICVPVLGGAPGIYSARYAGENAKDQDNVLKLLDTLKDNPAPRTARFQCVLVYMRHAKDPTPIICQASWEGQIDFVQRGDNGHGYDPIFIPEHHDCSAAQMNSDEKNALSHRGKALVQLIAAMQEKGVFTDGNTQ